MKIPGIPVGTTAPRPNWNQNDPKKADYIRNKPSFEAKQNRLAWVTDEDVEAMLSGTYEGVGEETYLNDDLVVDTLYALTDVIVAGKSFKDFEPGSGGGGGSVDLSNYYTRDEVDKKGYQTEAEVQALIDTAIENIPVFDSPLAIEVSTADEMSELLDTAPVGAIYKYVGETTDTYENGTKYELCEN